MIPGMILLSFGRTFYLHVPANGTICFDNTFCDGFFLVLIEIEWNGGFEKCSIIAGRQAVICRSIDVNWILDLKLDLLDMSVVLSNLMSSVFVQTKSLTFPMNKHSPGLHPIPSPCVRVKLSIPIHPTDSNTN